MQAAEEKHIKQQVVCLKWGDKYPSHYVNKLYNMVMRNTSYEVDFFCITDDPEGLDKRIKIKSIPNLELEGWWYKLSLFSNDIYDFEGRFLFMDLDVVIVDNIDALFELESGKLVIGGDLQTGEFNSSIFSLEYGSLDEIWIEFQRQRDEVISSMHGDQDWISRFSDGISTWPNEWIVSYKKQCNARTKHSWGMLGKLLRKLQLLQVHGESEIPIGAKVVQFHGKPDPEDVMNGPYGLYRAGRWIKDYWH